MKSEQMHKKSNKERMMTEMTSSHTEAASCAALSPGLPVQLFLGLIQLVFFSIVTLFPKVT